MSEFNRQRWQRLWDKRALRQGCDEVFSMLEAGYAEPHRHYHNARHISECLTEFDTVAHLASFPRAIELALWFHDAVYDPRAADNEERSATLARDCLTRLDEDAGLIDSVGRLVLATKKHETSWHPEASLMIDVDLSILGQVPARFWEYEEQIRAEYSWVPAATFASKRKEILECFLARPRVYHTELMFQRFEDRARANLRASVQRLAGA